MFPVWSATLHQGSYLVPLLLLYSLARILHGVFGPAALALLALHAAVSFLLWGEVAAARPAVGGWISVLATLLAAAWMVSSLLAERRTGAAAPPPAVQ
jgi:hypothetical protein